MSPDSEKCERKNLRARGMFPRAADDMVRAFAVTRMRESAEGHAETSRRARAREAWLPRSFETSLRLSGRMRGWRAERRKPLASAILVIAAAPLGAPFALMQSDKRYTRRCGDIEAHAATPYLCFRRAIKRMRGRVDLAFPVPGGRELGPLRLDAYPPAGRGLASFVSGPVCPPAPQAPHPVPLSRRLAKRPSADGVGQSVREVWRVGISYRASCISPLVGRPDLARCEVGAGYMTRSTPPLISTRPSAVTEPTIFSPSAMMVRDA